MVYNITFKESVEKDLSGSDKKEIREIFAAIKQDIAAGLPGKGEALDTGSQVYWKQTSSPCSIIYEIFGRDKTIRIDRICRNEADSE